MIVKTKKDSTRKIVRYVGGAATLLLLASFLYQWNNGLVIDDTETFGFMLAFTGFLSTFLPTKKKVTN
ncbi:MULTISPECIES: hypothetical protein [Bacillus]|uniref:Group-specific protein n=2 Tax=Bacillus cereus group TaxID=86661 RepID=A0A2C1D8N2_BACCE|nr:MULTISPECIES: hypothetical protein [Bacillus cereus group]OFD78306.1 hypothetical protein BWGOE8_28160 [Bacillus mycoides]OFD78701.1 hypothetical protein BWGOE9_28400 [Bacillus mycoides]OFD80467.1 hypothetical protein BWGOE10_28190 [Bacillus mycoides]PGS96258.1 hypothetical protein COD09_22215 [Bacillus cereus]